MGIFDSVLSDRALTGAVEGADYPLVFPSDTLILADLPPGKFEGIETMETPPTTSPTPDEPPQEETPEPEPDNPEPDEQPSQ